MERSSLTVSVSVSAFALRCVALGPSPVRQPKRCGDRPHRRVSDTKQKKSGNVPPNRGETDQSTDTHPAGLTPTQHGPEGIVLFHRRHLLPLGNTTQQSLDYGTEVLVAVAAVL
mmetsp:Transcript_1736/g.3279  ORF Transcript_1736/g.3279 Transcript_1736/m.3279 type:complete len:114 (+) Transcript_1736:226-567(+)